MPLTIDFAFEGFRILREKPRLIAIWGFARLMVASLFAVPAYYALKTYGPDLQQLMAGLQSKDPELVLGMVGTLVAGYLAILVLALLLSSIFTCAVFRAAYREPKEGLGYLRFGAAELRQMGVVLLLILALLVAYIAIILVVVGVVMALGSGPASVILGILGVIGLICAAIWFSVRISLFQVQTFATRKINLFGSLALTKGNFWSLLGGYLVMMIMTMLVSMLASVIITVIVGLVTGDMQSSATMSFGMSTGASSVKDLAGLLAMVTSPAFLLTLALQQLIAGPLVMTVATAPTVAAYRTLSGETAMQPESVF